MYFCFKNTALSHDWFSMQTKKLNNSNFTQVDRSQRDKVSLPLTILFYKQKVIDFLKIYHDSSEPIKIHTQMF